MNVNFSTRERNGALKQQQMWNRHTTNLMQSKSISSNNIPLYLQ